MTTMTFGRYVEFVKDHPNRDRIMSRNETTGPFSRVVVRVCRSRASMARQIRKQGQRESRWNDWRPCVKLSDCEGFN